MSSISSSHPHQYLAFGARARWKIENETFNTLKNHGYHLDHNFDVASKYFH